MTSLSSLKTKSAQPKLRTEKCKAPIAATQVFHKHSIKYTKKEHALLPIVKVYTLPNELLTYVAILVYHNLINFSILFVKKIMPHRSGA